MNTIIKRTSQQLLLVGLSLSLTSKGLADGYVFDEDEPFPEPLVQTTRFGISPFIGYRFGGEVEDESTGAKYRFDDSEAFGLFLDYAPLQYPGRLELLWSHQASGLNLRGNNGLGQVDLSIDTIQFGGVAEFGSAGFREYVSAHVGATHYSVDGFDDDTRFSFGIGAGVKAFLTKNLYLRADLRGFCTVVDAQGGFIYANGVTVVSFSGSTLWQGQVSVGCGVTF